MQLGRRFGRVLGPLAVEAGLELGKGVAAVGLASHHALYQNQCKGTYASKARHITAWTAVTRKKARGHFEEKKLVMLARELTPDDEA